MNTTRAVSLLRTCGAFLLNFAVATGEDTMKTTVLVLALAMNSMAICPPEPPEVKPLPPIGYSDTVHVCTCDSSGTACRWIWIATNATNAYGTAGVSSDIVHDLATFNPARTAAETQEAEARAREAQARAILAERQVQAAIREDQQSRQQSRVERDCQRFEDRVQAAKLRHPDFSQAIDSPEFQPSRTMRDAIFKSHVAGELAYWLATHLDDCNRIASLSPSETKRAIRKKERTLN